MLPKELENISLSDIELYVKSLIEGNTLEYKTEIKINSESETKEFLADISSFANSSGGDIIYGASETKGIVGVQADNIDSLILRLQQKIEDGIFPRHAFRIRSYQIEGINYVLIIRVPKSYSGPHSIKSTDHYFYRSEAGKRRMDFYQLRNAFLASISLKDEIQSFTRKRLNEILLRQTPTPIGQEAAAVMFLIPISYWNGEISLDKYQLQEINQSLVIMDETFGILERNFDGAINSINNKGYVQIYRNGIIESVCTSITANVLPEKTVIPTVILQEQIHISLSNYIKTLNTLNLSFPYISFLFLVGAQNYYAPEYQFYYRAMNNKIGKEILSFPEILIDHFPEQLIPFTKRWFDFLWQGFGYEECPDIQKDGTLRGSRRSRLI